MPSLYQKRTRGKITLTKKKRSAITSFGDLIIHKDNDETRGVHAYSLTESRYDERVPSKLSQGGYIFKYVGSFTSREDAYEEISEEGALVESGFFSATTKGIVVPTKKGYYAAYAVQ